MVYALVVLIAVVYIERGPVNPRYCPTQTVNGVVYDALGYVKVIKDGFLIAGGKGYYDPHTRDALTAWFPPERSSAQVTIRLDMRPDATGHIQIHTEGRGFIRPHRGMFCAYPEPPPKPEWYPGVPSPSPSPSYR